MQNSNNQSSNNQNKSGQGQHNAGPKQVTVTYEKYGGHNKEVRDRYVNSGPDTRLSSSNLVSADGNKKKKS